MKELTIQDLFIIFVENIKAIILTIILFVLLAVGYTKFIVTPMYESSTKIILVNSEEDKSGDKVEITTSDIALNQKLVSTYSEIITSRKVVQRTIEKLNLNIKYADLAKNITVTPVKDSEVINVSVKTENKENAANLANTLIESFALEVKEIYDIQNVKQLDKAIPSQTPYNVNMVKNIIIFSVIGFVLVYGILFLKEYFKTTISTVDELEQLLNLPIIGIVPELEEKE